MGSSNCRDENNHSRYLSQFTQKKRVRESEEKEVLKEINHLKEKVQNNPNQDMEDLEKAKEKMEQIRK